MMTRLSKTVGSIGLAFLFSLAPRALAGATQAQLPPSATAEEQRVYEAFRA